MNKLSKDKLTIPNNADEKEKDKYHLLEKIKGKFKDNSNLFYINDSEKIFYLKDSYYYSIDNNPFETFLENSKFISFINKEKKFDKAFFIHNQKSLADALTKAEIKEALIYNETNNSNNSNDSNNSSKSANKLEVNTILNDGVSFIEQEKSVKVSKIFSQENFIKRYKNNEVSELDFAFKYYKDIPLNCKIEFEKLNSDWMSQILNLYGKKTISELLILGPRGIGKTTALLTCFNMASIHRLYFPLKKLLTFNRKKWKKIALYEAIYIFDNQEEMKEFSNDFNFFSESEDLIHFIFDFIKNILEFFENKPFTSRIIVVLDDFDDSLEKKPDISDIVEYFNKNKSKLLLCILGESSFLYQKYYNYILNKKQNYEVFYWDLQIKNDQIENLLELPLYSYKYKNLKDNIKSKDDFIKLIKDEIKDEFNRIPLKCFFSLSKYLNANINIIDLKDDFHILPLQFLTLKEKEKEKENGDKYIKFDFILKIYKEIFNETIRGKLKIENIKLSFNLNKYEEENKGKDGIQFEDIIVEQLWNNNFKFITFPENNKIKVREIYQIQYYKKENYKIEKIEKDKPIIIRQTKFQGKYYDLLLIMPSNGKYYAIFIQIGLNKDKIEISSYYNNLIKNYENYKDGINYLINEQIEDLGFLLIFDYDRQKILNKKKSNNEGVKYCIDQDIAFLVYKEFQLYNDLDSKEPINSINIKESLISDEIEDQFIDLLQFNYNKICHEKASEKKSPIITLNDDEENKIINFINNQYGESFDSLQFIDNLGKNLKSCINLGIFGEKQISVIKEKNDDKKYISFNNEIFRINADNIKQIEDKDKYNKKKHNLVMDLYYLQKKRANVDN